MVFKGMEELKMYKLGGFAGMLKQLVYQYSDMFIVQNMMSPLFLKITEI